MSQNLQLDPKKRDYLVVNGSPISTDRVYEAAYYAIKIPLNNWLYGKDGQGSLVYTLANVKRSATIEQQFSNFVDDALTQQLINTGQATDRQVTNLTQTSTTSTNKIEVVPSTKSASTQFNFIGV